MGAAWPVVLFTVVACTVAYLIYTFASRSTKLHTIVLVYVAWFFCFSIVGLVPLDISQTYARRCHEAGDTDCPSNFSEVSGNLLVVTWEVLYWITFCLCWAVLPVFTSYAESGAYTRADKWKQALKENVIFYAVCGLFAGGFLIYLMAASQLDVAGIKGICIALANTWAMFLLVCLLGHGLVDVPRKLWLKGNREKNLRYSQFRAVGVFEALDSSQYELKRTIASIQKTVESISDSNHLKQYADILQSEIPSNVELGNSRRLSDADEDVEVSYKGLIKLRNNLKRAKLDLERAQCQWDNLLMHTRILEDVINNCNQPDRAFHSSIRNKRTGLLAAQRDHWEWMWRVKFYPVFMRTLSVTCAVLSVLILSCELTAFSGFTLLSIWNPYPHIDDLTVQVIISIPLCYSCVCTFYSIFKIKVFNLYELHPNKQTDGPSMLFNAQIVTRLVAPLCFNYMEILQTKDAKFYEMYDDIDVVPLFGDYFNIYFPIAILLFTIATIFNLFERVLRLCNINQLFADTFDESLVSEGQRLLNRERNWRQRQQQLDSTGNERDLTTQPILWGESQDGFEGASEEGPATSWVEMSRVQIT
eukprot:GFYU01001828.1.p1 GENE.GFYU01001828.1~~GFYU01001828.1.p1  ORF type:complete len:588 (-),score=24.12 GFYU01001828.1:148-1911(-)